MKTRPARNFVKGHPSDLSSLRYDNLLENLIFPLQVLLKAVRRFDWRPAQTWAETGDKLRYVYNNTYWTVFLVSESDQEEAIRLLRGEEHGSAMWRLLVCLASGVVRKEDVQILLEVIEAEPVENKQAPREVLS